jgi:DNA-binding transcriptional ArsR family regulator
MARLTSKVKEENGCLVRFVHMERVRKAKKEAISEREVDRLSLLYKALADPTRLKLAMALKEGEMCVCDMAAFLGTSVSAVSHQMRRLKDLSLVKSRREGQVLYYSLDDQHVADLLQVGLDHINE